MRCRFGASIIDAQSTDAVPEFGLLMTATDAFCQVQHSRLSEQIKAGRGEMPTLRKRFVICIVSMSTWTSELCPRPCRTAQSTGFLCKEEGGAQIRNVCVADRPTMCRAADSVRAKYAAGDGRRAGRRA